MLRTRIAWAADSRGIYLLDRLSSLLSLVPLDEAIVQRSLPGQALRSLATQTDAGVLVAVQGNPLRRDLVSLPLFDSEREERRIEGLLEPVTEVASINQDSRALMLSGQRLLFVSDRSGRAQFWLRDNQGLEQQLSDFGEHRQYLNLVATPKVKALSVSQWSAVSLCVGVRPIWLTLSKRAAGCFPCL